MGLARLVDEADMRVLTAQLQSADSVALLRLAMNVFGLCSSSGAFSAAMFRRPS